MRNLSFLKSDLATGYRPTTWDDVKGQSHVVNVLRKRVLKKAGIAGVYLFAGPSGVGKTTIARLFHKSLNCSNLSPVGNPCGNCEQCKDWQLLLEVDGASTGGKDDMRDLAGHHLYAHPGEMYRGILIDECHMLSKDAWAVLLRPFEEIPPDAVWLLATTDLAKVPDNIKTRCQIFELNDIAHAQIIERLKEIAQTEKIEISDKDLLTIAKRSNNLRQPILELAKYSATGELDGITEIVTAQNNLKNEKFILSGIQPQLVKVLIAMAPEVRGGKLKIKEIQARLNIPDVQGKQIANELRAMGLDVPTDKKIHGVSYFVWDSPKLANLLKSLK